jgi:hypothetical protein
MSRFADWFTSEQLKNMGWPKSKGFIQKTYYVDSLVYDGVMEQALKVAIGFGAGRPKLGVTILAEAFENNPWTKESTIELLQWLSVGNNNVENNPELPPWKALYAKYRVAPNVKDIPWQELGNSALFNIRSMTFSQGIYWGLPHEKDMNRVFAEDKKDYEKTASEAIPYGLKIASKYPWYSIEHFYQECENLFNS